MNAARKVVAGLVVALSLFGVAQVAQPASADDVKVSANRDLWCC